MNAVTDRGDAYSDYGEGVQQNSNEHHGAFIRSNNGGPNIDIHVNRGDITLRGNGSPVLRPTPLPTPRSKAAPKPLPESVNQ